MEPDPEPTPEKPRPRCRWFQYSLRSLLLLVTVCAIGCSWFMVKMQAANRQREAVKSLRKFPGHIQYDYQRSDNRREPPGPPVLRRLLGDDFFAHVEFVCLGADEDFTEADAVCLASLPLLKDLRLCGAWISDTGLAHLEGLSQLETLDLSFTKVSDAGLAHLAGLAQLRDLNLSGTKVTDAGLLHLAGLAELRDLDLSGTKVTDESVRRLQQALPDCRIER
ncbi:MAG: hypothetical protein NTW96_04010 [Planctomycetia bacterium]|nr:hypothetical protein [Planctomycetia bacterium]